MTNDPTGPEVTSPRRRAQLSVQELAWSVLSVLAFAAFVVAVAVFNAVEYWVAGWVEAVFGTPPLVATVVGLVGSVIVVASAVIYGARVLLAEYAILRQQYREMRDRG